MKIKITPFILILVLSIFILSCSNDKTAPSITLNGKNPDTLIVKTDTSYNDPGATATDNEDGDVTAGITVATNVKEEVVGHYLIYYTAEDKAGNVSERLTRVVEVVKADGTYDATYSCIASADSVIITSYSNNDSIMIQNVYSLGSTIKAGLNGTTYTIYQQELIVGTNITGTITASGTTLNANFVLTGGTTNNCNATYKRR